MRALLVGLSVIAAFVLMAVSAHLNYGFMAGFAHTSEAAMALGAAAVAGDILKACLPFFLVLAWRSRRWLFLVLGAPAWGLLSAVSLLAALGYAADIRDRHAQVRQTETELLRRAVADETRLVRRVEATNEARSPAVIEADLAALRQDARWTTSVACTEATVRASRTYCAHYLSMKGELETARDRVTWEDQLTEVRREIARLRADGAGLMREPQVEMLAMLSGESAPRVRTALVLLAALFLEVGSGLGLYLALQHSAPRAASVRESAKRLPEAAAPIALPSAQSARARMEAFWVARIVPAPGARLSIDAAWSAYEQWCAGSSAEPVSRAGFDALFWALVAELRLSRTTTAVRGLALAAGPEAFRARLPASNAGRPRHAITAAHDVAIGRGLSRAT
ncbi:hypothetical protein [Hyphomicrobium sp.]|uniref:hypothetical protein n=1 Tax=Hyphomicrobium sp. TaxID=82 RepID=UPI002FE04B6A